MYAFFQDVELYKNDFVWVHVNCLARTYLEQIGYMST